MSLLPDEDEVPAVASPSAEGWRQLFPDERRVACAVALGGGWRTRAWITGCAADPALAERGGHLSRPSGELTRRVLDRLLLGGWVQHDLRRNGQYSLSPAALAVVWRAMLEAHDLNDLREALRRADGLVPFGSRLGGPRSAVQANFPSLESGAAAIRLEALAGSAQTELEALAERKPWGVESADELIDRAVADVLDDAVFELLHPSVQRQQLLDACSHLGLSWRVPAHLDLAAQVNRCLAQDASRPSWPLRLIWADVLLLRGRREELATLPELLAPVAHPGEPGAAANADEAAYRLALCEVAQAGALAAQGHWQAASQRFEPALATVRRFSGARRQAVTPVQALVQMLALLAQGSPEALERALKFCLQEGGRREPVLDSPFGLIAEALLIRRGEQPLVLLPFMPHSRAEPRQVVMLDWVRWQMRAWLKTGREVEPLPPVQAEAAAVLAEALRQARFDGLARSLDAALGVLAGESPPPWYFVQAPREPWELTLEALGSVELSAPASGAKTVAGEGSSTRLLWALGVGRAGQLRTITPWEQRLGPRGWGKPKAVPLSRLYRSTEALEPADAAPARCIRQDSNNRLIRLDMAAAVGALIGHPAVLLLESALQHDGGALTAGPEVSAQGFVELVEGAPELDVSEQGGRLQLRLLPAMDLSGQGEPPELRWAASAAEQRELDALRLVCVQRTGPNQARVIRLNPAQKRVAQLLGPQGLVVPTSAAPRLQEVLTSLGSQFQIHSDAVAEPTVDRELPADPRLRAELSPRGTGLHLRLVAAPFGPEHADQGPRLVPGGGRARVVWRRAGQALGLRRDLAAERDCLERVLDACPLLPPPAEGGPCEWTLDSPDEALALVERLRPLTALQALDWPQGKALRVDSSGLGQLSLRVHSRQSWLELEGELAVDEQLVLGLKQLIDLAASHPSRFVPLGEGRYLALTQELRERLADLAAVAEAAAGANLTALRIPRVAAPWLQEAVQGTQVVLDTAFAERLERLDQARRLVPALPAGLQASLRPYQEEGFEWAQRLAFAGLGACLADDMGLGKTLQALAVLLARAPQGPALVVAPTSLMGNWRAEAQRFAPSLRVRIHAGSGANRVADLADVGPNTVLLVSYPLLQIDAAAFAARHWHTLVLDEAQAIKNAAAKRSQAAFDLHADFRLALSGTPIENRLAELWSIMNACNPGLLGTLSRFNERFAGPIERQRDRVAQRQLRRLIAPFILRRTKSQVAQDLPPRTERVVRVEAEPAEQAHYEALRRDALLAAERSLSGDAPGQAQLNILAGLTRLRRAACDPRLVTPQFARPGAKVQAFAELAAELVANGHKALVFSQFVDFLALLKQPLDAAGIAYQYLDGSTPSAERTRRVDAFQSGQGELFLISLKAGGFGLNLTVADYVVIADPWWNPATEDQASARAHRMGQQRPVTVYRLVNQGTLEDKILNLHHDKRELADWLLDDAGQARAVPGADELLALMRDDGRPWAGDDAEPDGP